MTSMKIVHFQDALLPCPSTSKIFPTPWPWTSKFKRARPLPLLSPNDNRSIKRKHNLRMSMLSGPSFRSPFVFSINSLILSGLPLTSFHLAEASLSVFLCLYTLLCAVVQNYQMSFIYNYSHFQYSFCNQAVLFAQLENVNKLWNSNRIVHVNKQNQNKNKTNSCHIQIGHVFYCSI